MEYKLGKVSTFYDSLHKTPKNYNIYGYPMVRVKDISTGFLDLSSCFNVSEDDYLEFSKKYKPQSGDIIITRVGTYGNIALVTNDKRFCLGQNTVILNVDKKIIDNKYLFYYLTSSMGQQQIESKVTGSTQKTISLKSLKEINIIRHNFYKEKQIGDLLYKIDNKINNNKQIIANLEELSQTLFKRWFVDFEFPDENGNPYKSNGGEMIDSELGMVPKGWNFEKLKLLIENIKDNIRTKSLSQEDRYVPIDLIPKRKLTFYDYKSSNEAKSSLIKFKKNDILLGSMRVYFHRVSLAPFDGITRNTVFTLRPRDERYLYYLLNAINKDDFIQYAANNSKGSTMPYAVWDGILDEVTVLNPPLQYLIEFNSIVQKYFDISIILLKQNRQLEDLRDTLLPKLMSGEIELPDDIEVNEDELSI